MQRRAAHAVSRNEFARDARCEPGQTAVGVSLGIALAAPGSGAAISAFRPFVAATMNARKSGWGRPGRERNSGWNCDPTKNGWSRKLDDLDEASVRRGAGEHDAGFRQRLAIVVVELKTMAVALVDHGLAVRLARRASPGVSLQGYTPSRIVPPFSSMSRCSGSRSMTGWEVKALNSVELASGASRTSRAMSTTAHCMPRQSPRYGTRCWRAYRDAQHLALDAAMAEAAGHDDAVHALERSHVLVEVLAVHPDELQVGTAMDCRMPQGLRSR